MARLLVGRHPLGRVLVWLAILTLLAWAGGALDASAGY